MFYTHKSYYPLEKRYNISWKLERSKEKGQWQEKNDDKIYTCINMTFWAQLRVS